MNKNKFNIIFLNKELNIKIKIKKGEYDILLRYNNTYFDYYNKCIALHRPDRTDCKDVILYKDKYYCFDEIEIIK